MVNKRDFNASFNDSPFPPSPRFLNLILALTEVLLYAAKRHLMNIKKYPDPLYDLDLRPKWLQSISNEKPISDTLN